MRASILFLLSIAACCAQTPISYFLDIQNGSLRFPESLFQALPPANGAPGRIFVVTDALTSGNCTAGGGTAQALCRSSGGSWTNIGGGSGSFVPYTGATANVNLGSRTITTTGIASTGALTAAGVTTSAHLTSTGTAPGIAGCGTGSPAISANATDEGGTVTLGTSPGSCVITFATAYVTNAPKCVVSFQGGTAGAYSVSTSAITITATGLSGNIDYRCAQ